MKTKLTTKLREKERKKREKGQISKIKQRQMKIYIHLRLTAREKEDWKKKTKE